jgi:hypothetical protein
MALIRTDGSEDRIASVFRVHECEQVTELTTSLCHLLETSVLIRATRCHLPEDDNHHSHRRGNLKSYISAISLETSEHLAVRLLSTACCNCVFSLS